MSMRSATWGRGQRVSEEGIVRSFILANKRIGSGDRIAALLNRPVFVESLCKPHYFSGNLHHIAICGAPLADKFWYIANFNSDAPIRGGAGGMDILRRVHGWIGREG